MFMLGKIWSAIKYAITTNFIIYFQNFKVLKKKFLILGLFWLKNGHFRPTGTSDVDARASGIRIPKAADQILSTLFWSGNSNLKVDLQLFLL